VPHLNRKRPFTYMNDMEPICYRQDGSYFMRNGDYGGAVGIEAAPSPEPPAPTLTTSGAPAKVQSDDMRLAINKALKARMADYGEEWQGIEHARKFLGIE
jgi:hypothetical protein